MSATDDAAGPAKPGGGKKRQRHVSECIGDIVSEDRQAMMLAEINTELKKNHELIPEVWFLVKKGKLAKSNKKARGKDMSLPRSCNKYCLIDKVRLLECLKEIEPTLKAEPMLNRMNKPALCRLLCWAIHSEENGAVPAKDWTGFVRGIGLLYNAFGQRAKNMPMKVDRSQPEDVILPDFTKVGCFSLQLNEAGTKFDKVAHWSGESIDLEAELEKDFYIDENWHEDRCRIMSDTNTYETTCLRIFEKSGKKHLLLPRIRLDHVGQAPPLQAIKDGHLQQLTIQDGLVAVNTNGSSSSSIVANELGEPEDAAGDSEDSDDSETLPLGDGGTVE
jgi:hypothetical protein